MIRNAQFSELPADDDHFFEAVRYLLAEMDAEETERFETRLAEDQHLRELVAEAMLLLEVTCKAEPTEVALARPKPVARRSFPGVPLGLSVALAASLLLAFFATRGIYLADESQPTAQAVSSADSEDSQLAAAWAERIQSQSNELTEMWDEELLSAATVSLTDDDTLLAGSPDAPPAWMIEVLSTQQEEDLSRPAM